MANDRNLEKRPSEEDRNETKESEFSQSNENDSRIESANELFPMEIWFEIYKNLGMNDLSQLRLTSSQQKLMVDTIFFNPENIINTFTSNIPPKDLMNFVTNFQTTEAYKTLETNYNSNQLSSLGVICYALTTNNIENLSSERLEKAIDEYKQQNKLSKNTLLLVGLNKTLAAIKCKENPTETNIKNFIKLLEDRTVTPYTNLSHLDLTAILKKLKSNKLKDRPEISSLNLFNTNLSHANLSNALLDDCFFKNTCFQHANMSGVKIQGIKTKCDMDMKDANLEDAEIYYLVFDHLNLDSVHLNIMKFDGCDDMKNIRFLSKNILSNVDNSKIADVLIARLKASANTISHLNIVNMDTKKNSKFILYQTLEKQVNDVIKARSLAILNANAGANTNANVNVNPTQPSNEKALDQIIDNLSRMISYFENLYKEKHFKSGFFAYQKPQTLIDLKELLVATKNDLKNNYPKHPS